MPLPHRRRERRFLALALMTFFAGCTSQVSDDLSVEGLNKSRGAVILMTAVLDGRGTRSCMKVGFQPAYSEEWRPYDLALKLSTGTLVDAGEEIVGSAQIAPGEYRISVVICNGHGDGNSKGLLEVMPRGGFATFNVAAGEVVNLGKLVIIETERPSPQLAGLQEYVYAAHVTHLRTDPRTRLNKDLAAHLVDRPMVLSQPPLQQAELARICKERRANPPLTIAPPSPPIVCALAGL